MQQYELPFDKPLVGVIMGSKSDWETMRRASEILDALRRAARVHGSSRPIARPTGWPSTPRPPSHARHGSDHRRRRRRGASARAWSPRTHLLPVLGVPIESSSLNGIDSLLSIVQMPGGCSGGHAGHRQRRGDQRGAAGRRHSGQSSIPELRTRLEAFRANSKPRRVLRRLATCEAHPARQRRSACWAAGNSGACSPSPRGAWATAFTLFRPTKTRPPARSPIVEINAPYDDLDASREFARGVSVVTFEFENVPAATAAAAAEVLPGAARGDVLHTTQHRLREKTFLQSTGFPSRRFGECARSTTLKAALGRAGLPAILKTAGFGYDGKGPVPHQTRWPMLAAAWEARRTTAKRCSKRSSISSAKFRSSPRAVDDGDFVHYGAVENQHAQRHSRCFLAPAACAPSDDGREAVEIARAVLEKLGRRRRAVRGVLSDSATAAADQRTGAAAAQLRPLHVRRLRHQPVRAATARRLRPAAGLDANCCAGGDGESAGRYLGRRRAGLGGGGRCRT